MTAPDASLHLPDRAAPAARPAPWACRCPLHARRLFTGALLGAAVLPAAAALPECKRSGFTKAVSADQVEQSAVQQYRQMLQQYNAKQALAARDHPQTQRLRAIAERMIPFATSCNERSAQWRWEVNLIASPELNAFCMPGGKFAFYWGILAKLQLSDAEVATIMGHEMAHALLEHAREQMGKNALTQGGLRLGAALLGLGDVGNMAAQLGSQLLSLTYSRNDESQADQLGMLLAAQSGYDPAAGVTLWKKMMAASGGKAPPKLLSTHPASADRIRDIEARLPRAEPFFATAPRPGRQYGPPPLKPA